MAAFDRRALLAALRSLARSGYSAVRRPGFALAAAADRGAVVFAGDSLIDRWSSLADDLPNLKTANRGINGDTSLDLLRRFPEDVLSCRPRAVVVLVGTNDLSAGAPPARVETNLGRILTLAAKFEGGVPVVLCRLPPRATEPGFFPERIRELNARIDRLASERAGVSVCDAFTPLASPDGGPHEGFFVDGLHLSPEGYKVLTAALAPRLADFATGAN